MREELLFEFANRIGAFVTYTLIQAMNSETYKSVSVNQDKIIGKYIENSIREIIPSLATEFRNLIDLIRHGLIQKRSLDERISKTPFFIEDKIMSNLLLAFSKIYPLLTYHFENIRAKPYLFKGLINNLDSPVNSHKKFLESTYEMWKKTRAMSAQVQSTSHDSFRVLW
jgi:hypothetical protein